MIDRYSVERIKPHKQYAVWAVSGNRMYPLCYIQKPKYMSDAEYEKVCKAIRLDAPKDFMETCK